MTKYSNRKGGVYEKMVKQIRLLSLEAGYWMGIIICRRRNREGTVIKGNI